MRRRAPVGLVALLIVGLGLTVSLGDAPRANAATICAAGGAIGGCVTAWTVDAPEFDAPAAVVVDPPVLVIVAAPPLLAPADAAPRTHLLRLAPKTSPPGSPVLAMLDPSRTRRPHDSGSRL